MKRRALLSACAVCAVSGCLGVNQSSQARLAWIWLRNDRTQRYEVDVSVQDGDEMVFSDAYQLPPADAESGDIRITSPVDGARTIRHSSDDGR